MGVAPTDGAPKVGNSVLSKTAPEDRADQTPVEKKSPDAFEGSGTWTEDQKPVPTTRSNQLVSIRAPTDEREIRPFLPDTILVMQGEGGRLGPDDDRMAIGTYGLRSCSGVFAWNRDTQESWCFHLANRSDLHHFRHLLRDIISDGEWKLVLAAGARLGHEQKLYKGRAYNHHLLSLLAGFRDGDRVSFEAIPRRGGPPSVEHDRAFICHKESGVVVEVDNQLLATMEQEEPELLGPEAHLRWVCANLFPAFEAKLHPTIIAYDQGNFTGELHRPLSEDLSARMKELESRFGDVAGDDETIARWLHEIFPGNTYLRERLNREPEFVEYMAKAIRTYCLRSP